MKKTLLLLALLCTVISTSEAAAQQGKEVHVVLKKLMAFEGDWSGKGTITLGDSTFEITYKLNLIKTNDGQTLSATESYDSDKTGSVKGSSLVAFNSNDRKVHWFSADNQGSCRDHLGKWTTSSNFVMEASETIDGQSFTESTSLTFWGKNTIDLVIERKLDGNVTEVLKVTLNRTM